jgi:hypothetical protein
VRLIKKVKNDNKLIIHVTCVHGRLGFTFIYYCPVIFCYARQWEGTYAEQNWLFDQEFDYVTFLLFEPRYGRDFPDPSGPAPRPTQPPVQRVLGLFSGSKAAGAWH